MRCNKKMLCDIFIETANERNYLATAKVEENKNISIRWTRYEPRKINEDMIEVNRLWIEFMIPDYFIYMSEEAVRELAVYTIERIKGNNNESTSVFINEMLSDKFRKRNLKRYLKRYNCVDTYDEKLMPIVSRMKENDNNPCISTGSTSAHSTNRGSKIFGKKILESSKMQNLNWQHTGNY